MQDWVFLGFAKHMSKCCILSEEEECTVGCKDFLEKDLSGPWRINRTEVIAGGGVEGVERDVPVLSVVLNKQTYRSYSSIWRDLDLLSQGPLWQAGEASDSYSEQSDYVTKNTWDYKGSQLCQNTLISTTWEMIINLCNVDVCISMSCKKIYAVYWWQWLQRYVIKVCNNSKLSATMVMSYENISDASWWKKKSQLWFVATIMVVTLSRGFVGTTQQWNKREFSVPGEWQ